MEKTKLDYLLFYLDTLTKLPSDNQIREAIKNAMEMIERELNKL